MKGSFLITGSGGFTGYFLVKHLRRRPGMEPVIIGADIKEDTSGDFDHHYRIDIVKSPMRELLELHQPDYIIHLAGLMPPSTDELMWKVNVGSAMNLFGEIVKSSCRPKGILIIGSAAEYMRTEQKGIAESHTCRGATTYGKTKYAQTELSLSLGRAYNLPVMVARPFNLVGPGLSGNLVAGTLCEQFRDERTTELKIGNVESVRDFIDIRDVVRAYVDILLHGKNGQIYNVCSGNGVRIQDMIDLFRNLTGRSIQKAVSKDRIRKIENDLSVGNYGKLNADTGWEPEVSLEQSISDMLREEYETEK